MALILNKMHSCEQKMFLKNNSKVIYYLIFILDCGVLDEEARQCLPDCSGHGVFDLEAQQCNCLDGWVGDDCGSKLCNLDCGPHGRSVN